MVQSLYDIALWKCIQLASRITDVGDIPYHLVKPVLKRLNAKQLISVEENSPAIKIDSDELWGGLIERDFPDRPALSKRLAAGDAEKMPNRTLYDRYTEERERLRASTAQRLRNLTQKLQKEKSKNSIVPIQGIMREPHVRRRTYGMPLAPPTYSKYGSKSIMGKAMKDVQHRQLMFGGAQKNGQTKGFRQFARDRPVRPGPEPRFSRVQPTNDGPTGIYLHRPIGPAATASSPTKAPVRASSPSQDRPNFGESFSLPESRKRKATSIFLQSKRMPRAPRIPPEVKKVEEVPKSPARGNSPVDPEKPGATRKPRSSIFH